MLVAGKRAKGQQKKDIRVLGRNRTSDLSPVAKQLAYQVKAKRAIMQRNFSRRKKWCVLSLSRDKFYVLNIHEH